MDELTTINIEERFDTIMKSKGFGGSFSDGYNIHREVVTGQVVVNGIARNQTTTVSLEVRYAGEGTVFDDKHSSPICGIQIIANGEPQEDYWFPIEDIESELKKIF